jgi:hypothetical protein
MKFLFAFLFAALMLVNAIQAKHFLIQTKDDARKAPKWFNQGSDYNADMTGADYADDGCTLENQCQNPKCLCPVRLRH